MDISAFQARPYPGYRLLEPLPWDRLVGSVAAAEDALARLDERLLKSPIRDGLACRLSYLDACASQWLDGELIYVEDLVLHDAMMDVRTPTAELVRAHAVLRGRRRIMKAEAGWALTTAGLDGLRGRAPAEAILAEEPVALDEDWEAAGDDDWSKSLAAIDAVVARSTRVLSGQRVEPRSREDRPSLIYDLDRNEDARLADWRRVVEDTKGLPATLAAAIALDAWFEIEPLQSQNWLGRQLAADLLRGRGKTRTHLCALAVGLKATPQHKRWKRDPATRLKVALEAFCAAAEAGLKEHERVVIARDRLSRRAAGRRSNSSLPGLIELAIDTPVVTAALIAARLKVTPRAATTLAQELGLRETTGRKRYRAWAAA